MVICYGDNCILQVSSYLLATYVYLQNQMNVCVCVCVSNCYVGILMMFISIFNVCCNVKIHNNDIVVSQLSCHLYHTLVFILLTIQFSQFHFYDYGLACMHMMMYMQLPTFTATVRVQQEDAQLAITSHSFTLGGPTQYDHILYMRAW